MIGLPLDDSGSVQLEKEAAGMKDLVGLTLFIMQFFDRVRYHPSVPENERAELIQKIDKIMEMPTDQLHTAFIPLVDETVKKYGWDKE